MRIVVMSDSHTAYGRVLDIVQCNQSADLFLHLGDGEDEFDIRTLKNDDDMLDE